MALLFLWTMRAMAVAVACLVIAPGVGMAQGNDGCGAFGRANGNAPTMRQLEAFRRRPAPTLGPEHRLKNGVAWRLINDAPTGLGLPRITWMPDRAAMNKANFLLEAAHGCLLLKDAESKRSGSTVLQPDPNLIALTYASSRLVSYVEMRAYTSGMGDYGIAPQGVVLDLVRNRRYEATGCGYFAFHLADFFDACSRDVSYGFWKIWFARTEAIKEAAASAPDNCDRRMGDLEFPRNISAYLTEAGLAIYDSDHLRGLSKFCVDASRSLIPPVVIPYQELEPVLKPGPWRDELLKSTAH
jgi:hypothetical protein